MLLLLPPDLHRPGHFLGASKASTLYSSDCCCRLAAVLAPSACCPLHPLPRAPTPDLYHLDHFLGAFKTACGPLVDCSAFTLLDGPPDSRLLKNPDKPLEPPGPGVEAVYVGVTDSRGGQGGVFELRLVQRQVGLRAGCWMTKSCVRVT